MCYLGSQFTNGGSIYVTCDGYESCKGSIINGQSSINTSIQVQFADTHALQNSQIFCSDLQCNIITIDNKTSFQGLLNSTINSKSTTENLNLDVTGDGILKNSIIQCPQKQSDSKIESDIRCHIIVDDDKMNANNIFANTIIKSQSGLQGVEIIICDNCYQEFDNTPIIQCGSSYNYSCKTQPVFNDNNDNKIYWQCQDDIDSDFICDNPDYIDLDCGIKGGDTLDNLNNRQIQTIKKLNITLDAISNTYDPWMEMQGKSIYSKSHLLFEWKCQYKTAQSSQLIELSEWIDCDEIFNNNVYKPTVYADFDGQDNIIVDQEYIYKFTTNVTDVNNPMRECETNPSYIISFKTIPNQDEQDSNIPLLTVNIQSQVQLDSIYIDTQVRMIGLLSTLDGTNVDSYFYQYRWSEISGKLSDTQLAEISTDGVNNKNLVIKQYTLNEEITYQFRFSVMQYKDSDFEIYLQTVNSSSISFTVKSPDVSVENSTIDVNDNCITNIIRYDTFHKIFDNFFNISFNGDDFEQNEYYQFGYSVSDYMESQKILLHSSLLSESYFNSFLLPTSSSIIFHVDIFDKEYKSVEINTSNACMIQFNSTKSSHIEPQCTFSYKDHIDDRLETFNSINEKQLFTIQTSHNILYLLQTENDAIKSCKYKYTMDLLQSITDQFTDLCHSNFVLQIAQVFSNWLKIIVSDHELSKTYFQSKNESYLENIFNLTIEILDPCFTFIDIDQNELMACSFSSVTQNNGVCVNEDGYDDEYEITSQLPILYREERYSFIFLSLIDALINVLDETIIIDSDFEFSMNLFALIRKSLYIYQLMELSVTIPYESLLYDSNTFQLCSYRTLNSNVTCSGSDISVFLDSSNTNNDGLSQTDEDINAVDFSVIFLYTNKSAAYIDDPCSSKKIQGELQGNSATIMLSSDSINITNLTSNVDIIFNENDLYNLTCVWLNEETGIWQTSGCTKIIENNGQIKCSCSHLTTFSLIKFVYDDCLTSHQYQNLNIYDMPYLSNLIFLILFIFLSIRILSDFILIFKGDFIQRLKKHFTDRAFSGPAAVFICVLFEVIICLEFHIIFTFDDDDLNFPNSILILSLLIPLIGFCWMFFGVLKTWIRITHSFGGDTFIVKRIEKAMIVFMIIFCLFIFTIITLIFLEMDQYIYYGEFIWCLLMSIFTISYIIYATSAIKVIWKSVMAVQDDIKCSNYNNKQQDEDFKLLKKLLSVSTILALYFLIKTGLTIYLATLNNNNIHLLYNFIWRLIDMIIEFLSLCVIYHLYGGGLKRLILKYNNIPIWRKWYKKCRKCYKSKRKNKGPHKQSFTPSQMELQRQLGHKKSHARIVSKTKDESKIEMERSFAKNSIDDKHSIDDSQIAPAYLDIKQLKNRNFGHSLHSTSTRIESSSRLPSSSRLQMRHNNHSITNTQSNLPTITQSTFDINHDHHHHHRQFEPGAPPFQSPPFQYQQSSSMIKKQGSITGSTTTGGSIFANIPNLKQLELPENSINLSHNDSEQRKSYSHQLQDSTSFGGREPSLYDEFSNAAKHRFPSLQRKGDIDAPLPEYDGDDDFDNPSPRNPSTHNPSPRDPSINISIHPLPSPSPNYLGHSPRNPSPSPVPITPGTNLYNNKRSKGNKKSIISHDQHPSNSFGD